MRESDNYVCRRINCDAKRLLPMTDLKQPFRQLPLGEGPCKKSTISSSDEFLSKPTREKNNNYIYIYKFLSKWRAMSKDQPKSAAGHLR